MLDTIINTEIDSIPYYLSRVVPVDAVDSMQLKISSFEFIPINKSNYLFDTDTTIVQNHIVEGMSGVPLTFPSSVLNVFFLIFALLLITISIVTRRDGNILLSYFKNIVTSRSRSAFKEQITIGRLWISVVLVIQMALILAMVITFLMWQYGSVGPPINNIYELLLVSFVGVIIFILLKYIVYRLIDYIFPDWRLRDWVAQYFTFIGLLSLVIYLPSLFVVLSSQYLIIAICTLIVSFVVILFVFYRNLFVVFVKNNIGVLNYFLYLCAIEIVPLILIYKSGEILSTIAGK